MSTIRLFFTLFFMSWLTVSCSGENPEKPTLTDKEKCEKIIDAHVDCLEKIADKKEDSLTGFVDLLLITKCAQETLKSIEKSISSEKMKSALKEIENLPSKCAVKSGSKDRLICLIRLQKQKKQKVCSP